MRQRVSTVTAMEGISRPVFHIAKELSQNSRSGLTPRFLSKKLDLPVEEIEYLVDVNHSFLYADITKVKLAPEGFSSVKRITEGLENHGDIESLFNRVRNMTPHEFRWLEEQLDITKPGPKKAAVEDLIQRYYRHPESIVDYVATKGFSETAREVFDIVWQSKSGTMPTNKIRAAHGGSEYEVEQALWELFRGLALCEMFRFDNEERLVRWAGLVSELRQWREEQSKKKSRKVALKAKKAAPGSVEWKRLQLTDTLCQLVAAVAARPARLRGDGELFREDQRRLQDIASDEDEPSLATCLWIAEGLGWLARVDNELRAGELEYLLKIHRFHRHRKVFDWLTSAGNEKDSRRVLARLLDELRPDQWYSATEFVDFAARANEQSEEPVLKAVGAHYKYVSPSAAANLERTLARSLEESLFWLGVVERSYEGADSYFRVTTLGRSLLEGKDDKDILEEFAQQGGEIVVQPNFDIVVPTQDMDPLLTVPLDQFAVRQSTGQATVYHLNKDSFTQALQEGHDGDAFVDYLVSHNRGGSLPANVMTTMDDWRGGLRRVRLRTVQIIESDDRLVMADLMHRRKFKKYLQPIDPQLATGVGKIGKADLIKLLEKEGFIVE